MIDNNAYASAWLSNEGQYRYTITITNIDNNSKHLKKK